MKKQNKVAFFNILSTLLLRGISIFSSPIFSRLLGTSGYGVLSGYNNWVQVFAILGTAGTEGTLVNARVEYDEAGQKRYQSAAMTLSICSMLLWTALITLLMGPVTKLFGLSRILVYVMLLQAFGAFCGNFLNSKFTYEFKADKNLYISVGVALSTTILALIFVLNLPQETRYLGRIAGNALVYILVGLTGCVFILRSGRVCFDRTYWKFCLALAIPSMFYNLSELVLGHSDLQMLRYMVDDSSGGIYNLAYVMANIMFTFYASLDNSWKPFFFDDMKEGRLEAVRSQAKNYMELFTVLAVGFVLLVTEVFHIYAGRDFWGGTALIPVFVGSLYLNFLCTFPVNYEYYHKKTAVVAVVTVVCALVNIALNYVMILKYGMVGAAAATALARVLQFTIHFVYARFFIRQGRYPYGTFHWLPYAAAFCGAVVLAYVAPWYVRWPLGAVIGIWELLQIKKRKSIF